MQKIESDLVYAITMESTCMKVTFCVIRILIFACDILTYPFYFIIQKPWKARHPVNYTWANEVSSFSSSSYNEVLYRSNGKKYYNKIELCKEMERSGLDTIEKVFNFICDSHQNKVCLGTRKIFRVEEKDISSNGKRHFSYEMGDYEWMTYTQMFDRALAFGRGVKKLGYNCGTKVVIFADTRGNIYFHL